MADHNQRRFGAVMMTDMVDSTATMTRLGPRYKALADHHDELVQGVILAHGGEVRGTGDGFMAIFDSVAVAVDAACALQWTLTEYRASASPDDTYHIRIGLSAGELQWGGVQTAQGSAINEAARAESKAARDEILATDIVRTLTVAEFGTMFDEPREVELKGLPGTTRLWRVDWTARPPVPGPIPLPGAFSAAAERPFYGRDSERQFLADIWDRTARGSRELALLGGEAGIGKSTLARTFAADVHAHGAWVLYGRCDPDGLVPYQPIVEALTAFAAHTADQPHLLGSRSAALSTIAPRIATGPAADTDSRLDESDRYVLFEAITDWLATNAANQPLLLVVDDLNWADRPTLQLVRHLVRSQGTAGFMVLATLRDTQSDWAPDFDDLLVDLQRLDGVCHSITLGGLDAAHIEAAVADRHGLAGEAASRLVDTLERYTGGNPLFLDSLLGELSIDDLLAQLDASDAHGDGMSVPDAIILQMRPRYRRLDANAQHLAAIAAVMGQRFRQDVLETVSGLSRPEVEAGLDELVEHGFVQSDHARGVYQFTHGLVRDAMVTVGGGSSVARLHVEIGNALVALAGPDLEAQAAEISLHLSHAVEPQVRADAADFAVRAARQALKRLAPAVAATHYQRALDIWADIPGGLKDEYRTALLMDLGYARKHSGVPGADGALLDAAEMAETVGDPRLMARAALASLRGTWSLTGAVDERKVSVLRRALAGIGEDDPALRARLLGGLASELTFAADRSERDAAIAEAVEIARGLEAASPADPAVQATLSRVLQSQHTVLSEPAGLAQRVELVAEMDERTRSGAPYARFTTATNGYWTSIECGDARGCRQRLAAMEDIAAELDQPRLTAYATFFGSIQSALEGRFDRALEQGAKALDLQKAIGEPDAEAWWVGIRYIPFLQLGRLPELIPDLERALAGVPGLGSMRAGLAHAFALSGDPDRCRVQLDGLPMDRVATLHQDRLTTLAMMAMASIECGFLDVQEEVREALTPFAGTILFNGSACFGPADHYLGLLAAAVEDFDAADAHYGAAADLSSNLAAPVLLAETNISWGSSLLRRRAPGDQVRARALIEYAAHSAEELGLDLLQARAADLVETP